MTNRIDSDYAIGIALIAALVALLAVAVWMAIADAQEWETFKEAHHCKVVSKVEGDVFNTFGSDSKGGVVVGIGSTPDKTGWLCDDGVTYYR